VPAPDWRGLRQYVVVLGRRKPRRGGGGPTPFDAVQDHVRSFFGGHNVEIVHFDAGPIRIRVPNFHVFRIEPGPRIDIWTYVTAGLWEATQSGGHGLEFVLAAQHDAIEHLEHLAMSAFYHAGPPEQRLDVGHTVPIGEPWVDGSNCDHLLIALPYPYGPELEVCAWDGGHARLLWLLPITEAERDYKALNGLEALESRFDDQAIKFWEPSRPSVA
jgi:hypothetical protein